jgi:hypothetical protein
MQSKEDNLGNKLGVVILSIFGNWLKFFNWSDSILNKNDKANIEFASDVNKVIQSNFKTMLEFIESQSSLENMKLW